jgi:hypothetical protein
VDKEIVYKEILKINDKKDRKEILKYTIKRLYNNMPVRECIKYFPFKTYFNKLKQEECEIKRKNHKNLIKILNKEIKKYQSKITKGLYITHNDRISWADRTRKDPKNNKYIQVKCKYCNKWFTPTLVSIQQRTSALSGKYTLGTENNFYCSDECKNSCPCFNRMFYRKGENPLIDYRKEVDKLTLKNYKKYKRYINPTNLKRSKIDYHLDHIYPVAGI